MKTFEEVTYKHGQFIDNKTKNRIIPVQDKEYVITGDDFSFDKIDNLLLIRDPLSPEAKALEIEKEYGRQNSFKILNAGERLVYRVGISKKAKGDKGMIYFFVCTLLEDLYLFKINDRSGNDPLDWRLADCQCELNECISGELEVTEKIRQH